MWMYSYWVSSVTASNEVSTCKRCCVPSCFIITFSTILLKTELNFTCHYCLSLTIYPKLPFLRLSTASFWKLKPRPAVRPRSVRRTRGQRPIAVKLSLGSGCLFWWAGGAYYCSPCHRCRFVTLWMDKCCKWTFGYQLILMVQYRHICFYWFWTFWYWNSSFCICCTFLPSDTALQ